MNDKKHALQELLNFINNAPSQSSDTIIANALYTNRDQLDELSLEALADRYFVS